MRRITLSPSARRDLGGIALRIAEAAGPGIASAVILTIRGKCRLIADTPDEMRTSRPEIGEGIRSFPVPPYVLYFRYHDQRVQVARVLHERQELERHFPG